MTYDLFHQLLCISSNQNDSSDFFQKLEHMTATEVQQAYSAIQTSSRTSSSSSDMLQSA